MVRPSKIARRARRDHEQEQAYARRLNLPTCPGCNMCFDPNDRRLHKEWKRSQGLSKQQQTKSELARSKIRKVPKTNLNTKCPQSHVIVNPKKIALAEAMTEHILGAEKGRSIYWTDGSRGKESECGVGVTYQDSLTRWVELSWHVRVPVTSNVLETVAIAKAIEIAWERCLLLEEDQKPSCVCIYSDCTGALELISKFIKRLSVPDKIPYGERLIRPGLVAGEQLKALNIAIELRYVPGHAGIPGNVKADDHAARKGALHSVETTPDVGSLIEGSQINAEHMMQGLNGHLLIEAH